MSEFCIPIRVTNEEDLYEPFLPSGLSFSGELTAYLEDYLEDRRIGEGLRLELQSDQPLDMDHFRNAYHTFVEKLIRRNRREIARQDVRAIISLAGGVLFICIGFVFGEQMSRVAAEIIASVGSFAMWAAIALFIETLPTLRHKAKLLKLFAKAEITFLRI